MIVNFTSPKSRIALQVARKIAPCVRAFKMHFNGRNLNGTVLLQSLTTSCWLYAWEQTNSSNKFAANLNMKGISFFTHPVDAL